jgi:hypothetical protein
MITALRRLYDEGPLGGPKRRAFVLVTSGVGITAIIHYAWEVVA